MVVGASRGIGKGIAVELALAGATVYVAGRTVTCPGHADAAPGSLGETVAEIEAAGGTAVAVRCDATDDDDLAQLYERVRAESSRLDVTVHSAFNAEAFGPAFGRPFWSCPPPCGTT